jgi:hypothetical protein
LHHEEFLFQIDIISLEFGCIRFNLFKIYVDFAEKKTSHHCRELFFSGPADGAHPITGEICQRGVGGNIRRGVSVGRFVNITANSTLVVLHASLLLT